MQDPHRLRASREKVLEVAIGREVRARRRSQEITVAELSASTGLSIGMLSKIENGNTSPSLTTLQILVNALSVPMTSFFRGFEETHTKGGARCRDAARRHPRQSSVQSARAYRRQHQRCHR